MAVIVLFLLLSAFCSVTAQQIQTNISLDSSLSPSTTSSWLSSSRRFSFGFYPQGNDFAVGIWFNEISGKKLVWTANRDDPPVSKNDKLLLTTDGRLVLQNTQGQEESIAAATPASYASMLDSGNFVLYDSNSRIIWQSFDFPTDTLLPGQRLVAGKELVSSLSETNQSTGRFRLMMQHDGNLVQYPLNNPARAINSYWASGTADRGDNVSLNLDNDGHLYLLNTTGFNIKDIYNKGFSRNGTILYRMTMDVDGIFRLYSKNLVQNGDWKNEWSPSYDNCDVKGICGLNGFCTLNDQQSSCICLPGFDFIDKHMQYLGCEKIFNAEACSNKKENTKYNIMHTLENTVWEDDPYSTLSSTKAECEDNCLRDCNCEAALFKNGECRKQKLPVRYGRRKLDDPTTAFVKVAKEAKDTQAAKESKKEVRKDILIIGVSFAACAVIVLVFTNVLIYRHRVWAYRKISEQRNVGLTEEIALRSFTYGELEKVTEGFKEELGRGSFGTVFKGALSNGQQRVVAVKRLENVVNGGEREFQNEMTSIGRTYHRNLVRLLGYCQDGHQRLLVYEYMSKGSLADFLFKPDCPPSWDERVRIALDIARGILYLHEECETQIIHCDIKPQNILMDEYQCAKIADFGLAKLLKPDQTRTFTGIRGTRGYVAPEWHRNLPITVKADVYSFGVVLLEIICCRKGVDMNAPEDKVVLVDWVYDCFEAGQLGILVADEDVDTRKLERMVRVGLWCIQDEPSLRPSIKKVVLMLEGTVDIPIPPSPTSFLSTI